MKVAAVAFAVLTISVGASAESLKSVASRMGVKISSALHHKDFKAFDSLTKAGTTPDFKYIEDGQAGQPMNRAKMVATLKMALGGLSKINSASETIVTCKEHGNTGHTTLTHRITAIMVGPDHKKHNVVMVGHSTDEWVKVGKTWKMASMTWKNGTMTMDGKPMDMSAPMPAKATTIR